MAAKRPNTTSAINGAKSRGPKTPEGKARSAGHNLRHGLLASNIVLDEEHAARFRALAAEFHDQLQPRDLLETSLVEDLIANRWRQFRMQGIEKATLSAEMERQAPALIGQNKLRRAAHAFRTLADSSSTLALINRYDARLQRQFRRDFNQFMLLRARHTVIFPFEPDSNPVPADPQPAPAETKQAA